MEKYKHIGLGTAAIGRPHYINIRQEKAQPFFLAEFQQKGREVLNAAYDHGIRYFDTAPGYGLAEALLTEWVFDKEDVSIEIATKWGYTYTADFKPNPEQHEVKEHSLTKLNEQWMHSKTLLSLLTTYQIHSATFATGVLENQEVLERLAMIKEEYCILIGLTTTGPDQVEVLKRSLDVEVDGNPLFEAFQMTYNIFDQSLAEIANELAQNDKRLIIKEALANGRIFPNTDYPFYKNTYDKLKQLAHKYEVGVDAVALRFCIDSIPLYKVLSGAANADHLSANLKAADFKLEQDEIEELKSFAVSPIEYWSERKKLTWN